MRILKISLVMIAVMFISTYTAFASPKVTADKTTFDILSGTYKLDGNVHVETGKFTVTADHAQVNLTSFEVWAQSNINCLYGTNEEGTAPINFSGNDLYGSWAEKTITVKDGTQFKSGGLSIKADKTVFNWETKIADFSGNVEVVQDGKTKKYDQIKYNVAENKFLNDAAD
ncbi:LptA/OstA family protein [Pectinatus haikarae]|uniref:Lipopolysaccharide export system protein LptA n=1 Tax=Pectinatus haikarae TaxID=349096 RepID=A0ABT9Y6T4_9FIRM|nr:LptA/OstA family protein [Pectinatus haikarae]MDQ0203530.1 lipopolysaccharide export system protein LptA [Pectinatus haikarae]